MIRPRTGIGLTLGQIIDNKETVIAYAGRDFNPAERNCSATERESLAVIDGIKRVNRICMAGNSMSTLIIVP